ncbi:hypothetical protein AB7849_19345 [Rhodanobacter sp. 115]|uniref:hypothetical protein n=1 Tax=Rhodanobacter sp. FW021-MT20 TaxID=1162282 RepID=UPI0034E3F192
MKHKNYLDSLNITAALWWFIENVAGDATDRNDYFFYLRERYRNEFQAHTGAESIEKAGSAESNLPLASFNGNIAQGGDDHRVEEALSCLGAALRGGQMQGVENESAPRGLRLPQGLPRFVVDGHEFPNEESSFTGDGKYPPFVVFDIDRQENLPGEYATRGQAELVASSKNNMAEGWDLWDVDGTGMLEIQRVDEANVFATDQEAVLCVRLKAALGSVRHRQAAAIHDKHRDALLTYRRQGAQAPQHALGG